MFVLVLAAEADETRQAITFLIVCLVGIAVLLAALTVWYWVFTSPKRRAELLREELNQPELLPTPAMAAAASGPQLVSAGVGLHDGSLASDVGGAELVLAGPAMLSESSDLLHTTLSGAPDSTEAGDKDREAAATSSSPASSSALGEAEHEPSRSEVADSAEPRRIEVADRCPAPSDAPASIDRTGPPTTRKLAPARPPVPRIPTAGSRPTVRRPQPTRPAAVTRRLGLGDELAKVHNIGARVARNGSATVADRTRRSTSGPKPRPQSAPAATAKQGLSDEDWASVMKSAFDKMGR